MANENNIKEKEEQVKVLAEEFKNAGLIMLVDYRGINVADDTALRKTVREANGKYAIIKNNIVRRALAANSFEVEDSLVEGPTAVITTTAEYLPTLKAIYKFASSLEGYYNIKVGVLEGKTVSRENLIVQTVCGNICESGDLLAKERKLPAMQRGDLACILDTGAYGYSMCSTYNSRPRPAEVLICRDGKVKLIRRRETIKDLMRLF